MNPLAYFKPTTAGVYHLEVAQKDASETDAAINPPLSYRVAMRKADDHPASTATTATATVGGETHGFFFAEHNSVADSDWVKVSLTSGVTYRFTLAMTPPGAGILRAGIQGIYNSSGTKIADGTDGCRQTGWVTHHYTPSASGDHYVALGFGEWNRANPALNPAPDWTFKMWSSADTTAISESTGELNGVFNGINVFNVGHVPTDGAIATGSIHPGSDRDLFAVWLEPGIRYRITAYEIGGSNPPVQVRVYQYPKFPSQQLRLLATSFTNDLGYTNVFYTVDKRHTDLNPDIQYSTLYLIQVSTENSTQSEYNLYVHPASQKLDATGRCYYGRPVAWVTPGTTASVPGPTAGGQDCGIEMELKKGTDYTIEVGGGHVSNTIALFSPSSGLIGSASTTVPHTYEITAEESGIYYVHMDDSVSTTQRTTVTLTERTYPVLKPDFSGRIQRFQREAGLSSGALASRLGVLRDTVILWRDNFILPNYAERTLEAGRRPEPGPHLHGLNPARVRPPSARHDACSRSGGGMP